MSSQAATAPASYGLCILPVFLRPRRPLLFCARCAWAGLWLLATVQGEWAMHTTVSTTIEATLARDSADVPAGGARPPSRTRTSSRLRAPSRAEIVSLQALPLQLTCDASTAAVAAASPSKSPTWRRRRRRSGDHFFEFVQQQAIEILFWLGTHIDRFFCLWPRGPVFAAVFFDGALES